MAIATILRINLDMLVHERFILIIMTCYAEIHLSIAQLRRVGIVGETHLADAIGSTFTVSAEYDGLVSTIA